MGDTVCKGREHKRYSADTVYQSASPPDTIDTIQTVSTLTHGSRYIVDTLRGLSPTRRVCVRVLGRTAAHLIYIVCLYQPLFQIDTYLPLGGTLAAVPVSHAVSACVCVCRQLPRRGSEHHDRFQTQEDGIGLRFHSIRRRLTRRIHALCSPSPLSSSAAC